jgi:hypothetical protein
MVNQTKITRVDKTFLKKLDGALDERYKNKLITRKEFSRPEGFRLLSRIPEFDLALEKLKKLPKKENVKW